MKNQSFADDLAHLVSEYEKKTSERVLCLIEPNTTRANALFDEIQEILASIATLGQQGAEALIPLLSSEDVGVRLSSSTHLLGHSESVALEVLSELANSDSVDPLIRFTARQNLRAWFRGSMKSVFSE